jgi:DNA mismatch repair ATPase MutS
LDEANNDFESDKSGRKSKMSVKIIQTETYRYLFELPKSIYQEKKDELKKYRFISEKSNKVKLLTDDLKKALVRTVELEREYERRSNQMLKHLSKNVSKFYEQLEALAMLISNIDCLNSFAIMIINQRHFSGFDLEEERQKVYCRPIVHENTDNINFRAPNRAESEVFSEEKHGHKGAIINLENSRHPVLLS